MAKNYQVSTISGGGPGVSQAEAKDRLDLPQASTGHDNQLDLLRAAATTFVEQKTGASILDTVHLLSLEQFPASDPYAHLVLPRAPVTLVTELAYYDEDDARQVLADVTLHSGSPSLVTPDSGAWPTTRNRKPGTVEVNFTAGLATLETLVPAQWKVAILQVLSDFWEFRGQVVAGQTPVEVPGPTMAMLTQLAWGSEFEVFGG